MGTYGNKLTIHMSGPYRNKTFVPYQLGNLFAEEPYESTPWSSIAYVMKNTILGPCFHLLTHLFHTSCPNHMSDSLIGDIVIICNLRQWFSALKDTTSDILLFFKRDTMLGFLWAWSPFRYDKRLLLCDDKLHLKVKFPIRGNKQCQRW